MTPILIGTTTAMSHYDLAERAIARMGKRHQYAVAMDVAGRVLIGMPGDFQPREILIVCGRTADPDLIADEIRHEYQQRNK